MFVLKTFFPTVFSIFTRNGDVVTVTTPSDCRWLQVEFRPIAKGGEGNKEEENFKKIKVPATGNMVSSLFVALSTSFISFYLRDI